MPDIARADAEIGAWHAEIVRPLRRVRQRMKGGPAPAPSVATEALRTRLKAVEIEAERIELAVLERFGLAMPEPAPGAEDGAGTRRNLGRVVAHYSGHDLDDQTAERLRIIEAATRLAPKET